jgi:putative Mn2+ efflux pump MntP
VVRGVPHWPDLRRERAITPIIGYALGHAAADDVQFWDHWLAFVLLGGLGLRLVYGAPTVRSQVEVTKPTQDSFSSLATTGLATSIDVMAVRAGLALVKVNIWPVAAAIGLATCVMATLGVMVGRVLGAVAGRWAEAVGGMVLVEIGAAILYRHLSAQ